MLAFAGLLMHAPLYYQLPRWANGLDPTFVHPMRIEHSGFPLALYMARVHPVVWMSLIVLIFVRICYNYGWRLKR